MNDFITSQLNSYFSSNKDKLNNNYPGIKVQRLLEEFNYFNLISGLNDSQSTLKQFAQYLSEGKPLEYISNCAYFFNSRFFVDDSVLIPRSESEILVEEAIEFAKRKNISSVLELGVGSGALLISILQELSFTPSKVVASDISEKALSIAKRNFYLHKNKFKPNLVCNFICSDLFDKINQKFDLIISNPPYIKRLKDRTNVHKNVLKYEPDVALFLDDEKYFLFFERIFKSIQKHLNIDGLFLMEGHEDHLEDLKELFSSQFNVKIIKDYNNKNRFLRISHG